MPGAERDIFINAPIDTVFDVISDYEKYPEFLPEMTAVRLTSREGNVAVVSFELEIIMRVSYVLRLTEDRPHRLSWTLEEAKMIKSNVGGWSLVEEGSGTRATYGLEIAMKGLIPKSVSNRLIGQTLPETLERFRDRAETLVGG